METVTCSNGVQLTWDNTITVGELVTTYHSGYFIVHRIEYRDNQPPVMHYTKVVNVDGTLTKRTKAEFSCDANFVRKVTRLRIEAQLAEEVNAAHQKHHNLAQFILE